MRKLSFETELQRLNADRMSGTIENIVSEAVNKDFHGVNMGDLFADEYINEYIVISDNNIDMYETAYDFLDAFNGFDILEEEGIEIKDEFIEKLAEVCCIDTDTVGENGVYSILSGMTESQEEQLMEIMKNEDLDSMFETDRIHDMIYEMDHVEIMWNTIFEAVDRYDASWLTENAKEVLEKTGIYVVDISNTNIPYSDTGVYLAIAGAGYSFYDSHWIPLYVETDFSKYIKSEIVKMVSIDVEKIKESYNSNATMQLSYSGGNITFSKANTNMDIDYTLLKLETEIQSYVNKQEIILRSIASLM